MEFMDHVERVDFVFDVKGPGRSTLLNTVQQALLGYHAALYLACEEARKEEQGAVFQSDEKTKKLLKNCGVVQKIMEGFLKGILYPEENRLRAAIEENKAQYDLALKQKQEEVDKLRKSLHAALAKAKLHKKKSSRNSKKQGGT
jgi:hypothetical protein